MANVRELKKDINYVLGDIIEAAQIWEITNPEKDNAAADKIVDDAIETFDTLIAQVNAKAENKGKHLKEVRASLETKGRALIDRINGL